MRNYIILNGKNSNEINGLLIQELPPISKPLIRTEVEEIDGRDGDIVTPLGYSAYDKELTIGLYKDFDVNEVAAYFNSEGTVIFSNEPDKYYYYQITAQIDFERLVRYRTATVTMHCQPFKYSANEQPITEDVSGTVSDEGTNLALENTAEAPFNTLDLKGNTSQQTYSGKNLLNMTGASNGGVTGTIANGSTITVTGKANTTDGVTVASVTTMPAAGTYTLTIDHAASHVINLTFVTSSGNVAFRLAAGETTVTKTFAVAPTSASLFWAVTNDTTYNETFKLQLVAGSTADYDFEPYVGGTASPNPDYPQAVQTVTGENVVKICGKNLVKPIASSTTTNGVTFTANDDGTYTANGTATAAINFYLMGSTWIDAKAGTYTASDGVESGESNTTFFTFVDGANGYRIENEPTTFTLASDTNIRMRFVVRSGATLNNVTFKPMIEKSSQATDYEPYQEQSYPISLGTLELCKLGNQQDYIYKSGDKWYKHQVIGKAILDGTESWTDSSTSGYVFTRGQLNNFAALEGLCYCDQFTRRTGGHGEYEYIWIQPTSGALFLQISDSRLSAHSLAAFKTWLSENTPVVYYVLATPTDTEITNEALIAQLDDIYYHAHSYKGRTHIASSAATGNVPHIIAAEVGEDNESTITNAGNYLSKPKITVYGSGDISLYINDMHALQITLGDEGYITIDTAQMEAYKDTLDNLKNRLVIGDYSNARLKPGANKIHFTGTVTKYVVENYSRWL